MDVKAATSKSVMIMISLSLTLAVTYSCLQNYVENMIENQPLETAGAGPQMYYNMFGCVTVTSDFCLPSAIPPLLPACDPEKVYMLAISLTVYSLLKKKASIKSKAPTSKEEKLVKVTELHFPLTTPTTSTFSKAFLTSTDRSNTRYWRRGIFHSSTCC
jgi:hypothetical protein